MGRDLGRRGAAEFLRLRRADEMRHHQKRQPRDRPGRASAEHQQPEAAGRGDGAQQPPPLPGAQLGGHRARHFGRKAERRRETHGGKARDPPEHAFAAAHRPAGQGEAGDEHQG